LARQKVGKQGVVAVEMSLAALLGKGTRCRYLNVSNAIAWTTQHLQTSGKRTLRKSLSYAAHATLKSGSGIISFRGFQQPNTRRSIRRPEKLNIQLRRGAKPNMKRKRGKWIEGWHHGFWCVYWLPAKRKNR